MAKATDRRNQALGGYYAENIVQAVLVAGIPTYGYEFYKNGKDVLK